MSLWELIDKVRGIKKAVEEGNYIDALGRLANFISAAQVKVGFPVPTEARMGANKKSEVATVDSLMQEIDGIGQGTSNKAGSGFQDWAGFITETMRNFVNTWVKTHPDPSPETEGDKTTTEES